MIRTILLLLAGAVVGAVAVYEYITDPRLRQQAEQMLGASRNSAFQ